jgi:hypothetical protein
MSEASLALGIEDAESKSRFCSDFPLLLAFATDETDFQCR